MAHIQQRCSNLRRGDVESLNTNIVLGRITQSVSDNKVDFGSEQQQQRLNSESQLDVAIKPL